MVAAVQTCQNLPVSFKDCTGTPLAHTLWVKKRDSC